MSNSSFLIISVFVRRACALGALVFATAVAHAQWAYLDDFKANPAKSVEMSGTKALQVSNKLLVPTLYLRVSEHGSVFAAKSKGSSTASAKGKYAVVGLDRSALMALAKQLQDDFVARLRADGWEVLTYDDIKADPGVGSMELSKGEGSLNLPAQKDAGNGAHYVIAAPSDAQNFKPAFQGPTWGFRFVAKAMNATVIIPQIDIVVPQVWTETSSGYKSASASVKSLPGMNMNHAMVLALTPKGGGGVIAKLKGAIVNTTTNAGKFIDVEDKSPTAANALSKGLSILGGGGSINRASGNYVFELDAKNFAEGVKNGSQLFLSQVAKSIASERK